MKTLMLRSILLLTCALLTQPNQLWAQADRPAANDRADRLERLERRLDELAQRQEQFMRRVGNALEQRQQSDAAPVAEMRGPAHPQAGPSPIHHPPNPGAKAAKGIADMLGLLFIIGVICNILLAIWIYTDIRKRNEGSGIFVAMALVAGIPAAIIYALTRIGDRKA